MLRIEQVVKSNFIKSHTIKEFIFGALKWGVLYLGVYKALELQTWDLERSVL